MDDFWIAYLDKTRVMPFQIIIERSNSGALLEVGRES